MKVVTANQMREIDRISIEERGIPSLTLMENAGKSIAVEVINHFDPDKVAVVCGKGNNAGDGFVAARLLCEKNVETIVTVILLSPAEELKGDAKINYERLPHSIDIIEVNNVEILKEILSEHDCVIDAILGTGIKGKVEGFYADAINTINDSRLNVVSADIPSGLPADGGDIDGACIRAKLTITMGLPKIGMLIQPGIEYTGKVITAEIGFPDDLLNDEKIKINLLTDEMIKNSLPKRPRDGHKGTFGKLLVLAGSSGMGGAGVLCAKSAMRSGVGYVYMLSPQKLMPIYETHLIEQLKFSLSNSRETFFSEDSFDEIVDISQRCNAFLIGPGLGKNPSTANLVRKLIPALDMPIILDADGIDAVCDDTNILLNAKREVILTPHPGEMSRLAKMPTSEIQSNRIETAQEFAEKYKCTLVLKGAQTIIADKSGQAYINPTGNTGLAKGGSGDVLAGLIGGLAAQGTSAIDSAICGTFIHGKSADIAAKDINPRSMIPSDIIDYLGKAF